MSICATRLGPCKAFPTSREDLDKGDFGVCGPVLSVPWAKRSAGTCVASPFASGKGLSEARGMARSGAPRPAMSGRRARARRSRRTAPCPARAVPAGGGSWDRRPVRKQVRQHQPSRRRTASASRAGPSEPGPRKQAVYPPGKSLAPGPAPLQAALDLRQAGCLVARHPLVSSSTPRHGTHDAAACSDFP